MKIVGNINKGIELMNEAAPAPELPKLNGCTSAMASGYFGVSPVSIICRLNACSTWRIA